ncbi:MlaD family protein [Candidatus Halobeggiatoa sp. HSG11]|nr:MlaD family protein [Candidatus Halobeggiatoa sp. HSG11]
MDSKVSYAIVGLFVIVLGIVLIASILWLSVDFDKKQYRTYQVYIQESVSGLNLKSPVKYNGVAVGYVDDINLDPKRPNEVQILLNIEHDLQLRQDTTTFLSVQGLTGLAYIELTGGSIEAPILTVKTGQKYPELRNKPSLLARLDATVSSLLDNLNSETTNNLLYNINNLSKAANVLLSNNNINSLTNTLQNFEIISDTLATHDDDIEATLVNTLKITTNIDTVSRKIVTLTDRLENSLVMVESGAVDFAEIAGTIKKTSHTFSKTVHLVNHVVQEVETTTKAIGKIANDIGVAVQNSRHDMDYFTRQALPEVTNSLREMQVLLNTLHNFTRELERKPNMLLFGK